MAKRMMKGLFRLLARNGYAKLCFLFAAVLLWQWFDSLEGYWWPQTFAIVHTALIAGTAIEFLVPGRLRWRLPLHAAAALASVILYSGFRWVPFPEEWKDAAAWGGWFGEIAEPLSPYIGVIAAAYGLFLFAGRFSRTRPQVALFCGAALVSLAVLDSFTTIYLWDEVAWCVFVSLCWLIAEHFERFRRSHPDTWVHLIEYPVSFGLPVVAVVGLVMAAGLLAPSVNPVLKDPYTLWMEARGESVPSFVGDKVRSLPPTFRERDTRSGYSRADDQLGDGFEFDYSEVMVVNTNRRSYWRGETKSEYTGQGWVDSEEEQTEAAMSGLAVGEPLPKTAAGEPLALSPEAETMSIIATVTMRRDDPFPVLFGAHQPSMIRSIDESDSIPPALAWLPQSAELRWPRSESTPYPESYTIESEQVVLDEELLRSAGPPNPRIAERYTRLPSVPERVLQLAEELTSGADSDYDKVRRIEAYLKENYPYTNTPDISKRRSEDFVDSFLFEVQEGYCDYFSTAMAVLARASGIPVRWVKGYAPGALPSEVYIGMPEDEIDPNRGGSYTVRNADAHSWVEVYFEGFGWIPFEPTPGFSYPYTYPAGETPELVLPELSDIGPVAEAGGETEFRIPAFVGYAAGALAAAALLAWMYLKRESLLLLWRRIRFGAMSANEQIVHETERLIRICRRRGLERSEHETLRETVRRWSERRRSLAGDFQDVLAVFERAKYGGRPIADEEVRQFAAKVKLIRERL
jgi:Transglutaminase-like enzymes, putative cysteine proteases